VSISIGGVTIGRNSPPFIIAEMSGNHNGSLDRALAIVDAVAQTGARALKLQTYTADTMTINHDKGEFFISDRKSLWYGQSLYALYQQAHTPWEWHEPIFRRATERGLVAFSSAFDESAVEFLQSLDVAAFKVASFENVDLPLIRRIAATGKPMIISTGMANVAEIDEAVRAAREAGCRELILLKCTSSYPASPRSSNLATIPYMREVFGCEIGLSDHTLGLGAAVASIALGATVIEKHVTLRRADGGVDSQFSMQPEELSQLVTEATAAWEAVGTAVMGPADDEKASLIFRRSLYVCADLRAGDVLTRENLRAIRPGFGLPPKYLEALLGKRVVKAVRRATPADWSIIG
jgi:pseudaminic acid synthase